MRRITCLFGIGSIFLAGCMPRVTGGCIIQPHSECRQANLNGSDLSGANLFGVDLSGADLSGANLHRAYLRWTDLRGANLRGANLTEVDLRMALYDSDTIWPQGLHPIGTGAMFVPR